MQNVTGLIDTKSKIKSEEENKGIKVSSEEFMKHAGELVKHVNKLNKLKNEHDIALRDSHGKLGNATRRKLNDIERRWNNVTPLIHDIEEAVGMNWQGILKLYEEILKNAAKNAAERVKAHAEKLKEEAKAKEDAAKEKIADAQADAVKTVADAAKKAKKTKKVKKSKSKSSKTE